MITVTVYTTLLEKYPTFFFENLVDFNEVHLHEGKLNLNMHTLIFSRLSMALVHGKQHLSELVFRALVGFSFQEKMRERLEQRT